MPSSRRESPNSREDRRTTISKFNPFGDEPVEPPRRVNPFGEEERTEAPGEAAERIEYAARRIRGLRSQMGSEGLTLSATRELIDELTEALDSAARALRKLAED